MRIGARLKGPTPIVASGFAALALAIAVNALFLQAGRHPAPLFVHPTANAGKAAERDPLVEAVQSALKSAGSYSGPVDGALGPQTKAAIAAFQRSTGRTGSGIPTPDLPGAIKSAPHLGQAGAVPPAPTPPPQNPVDVARVAAVQEALARAAYGQLRSDGVFGPQTEQAIRRFQEEHGLTPTGAIDDRLIVELRVVGAMGDR